MLNITQSLPYMKRHVTKLMPLSHRLLVTSMVASSTQEINKTVDTVKVQLLVNRLSQEWDEQTVKEAKEGVKITNVKTFNTLSGDIIGTSTTTYTMAYLANQTAFFSGVEFISGTVKGQIGTFMLHHEGTFDLSSHTLDVIAKIIPASGTENIQHISGDGKIIQTDDHTKTTLMLDVAFD